MKTSLQNRKRKEGAKAVKQGLLGLLIVAVLGFGASQGANMLYFSTENAFTQFLGVLLMIITFALTVVGSFLVVLIGIYYYIRFFKYTDENV